MFLSVSSDPVRYFPFVCLAPIVTNDSVAGPGMLEPGSNSLKSNSTRFACAIVQTNATTMIKLEMVLFMIRPFQDARPKSLSAPGVDNPHRT